MNLDNFPTRTFIGITGHRDINDSDAIRSSINDVIADILERASDNGEQKSIPSMLSALAEGTDRLAADAALEHDSGELHAVLPLKTGEYKETFESEAAKQELDDYLDRALTVTVEPDREDKPGVYLDAGKAIVDTSDILLAVLDGNSASGEGGTEDIVRYARRHQKPLILIDPRNPEEPTYENLEALAVPHHKEIAEFNDRTIDEEQGRVECEEKLVNFKKTEDFDTSVLHGVADLHEAFDQIFRTHCPVYEKAERVSCRNQRLFKAATILTFSLAAVAVGIVSVQNLFFPSLPQIVALESLAMVGILVIVVLGGWNKWHNCWLKYRTLSEKVRSRWYVGLCTRCAKNHKGHSPVDNRRFTRRWVTDILLETWSRTSLIDKTGDIDVEVMKNFLRTHWIDNQINYHERNVDKSKLKNKVLLRFGHVVFLVTLIASGVHALELTEHTYTSYILLVSFFLPSVGSAVGAIRLSRGYETEALRSERIVQQLKDLRYQLRYINDPNDLLEWALEAETILELEHHNWRNIHEGESLDPAL